MHRKLNLAMLCYSTEYNEKANNSSTESGESSTELMIFRSITKPNTYIKAKASLGSIKILMKCFKKKNL